MSTAPRSMKHYRLYNGSFCGKRRKGKGITLDNSLCAERTVQTTLPALCTRVANDTWHWNLFSEIVKSAARAVLHERNSGTLCPRSAVLSRLWSTDARIGQGGKKWLAEIVAGASFISVSIPPTNLGASVVYIRWSFIISRFTMNSRKGASQLPPRRDVSPTRREIRIEHGVRASGIFFVPRLAGTRTAFLCLSLPHYLSAFRARNSWSPSL